MYSRLLALYLCTTHEALVDHADRDIVVVCAVCGGVDAGEFLAAVEAGVAVVCLLTRAFTALKAFRTNKRRSAEERREGGRAE